MTKNNSQWGEEKNGGLKSKMAAPSDERCSVSATKKPLEILPPSPARKSPAGFLAETPRDGGEDRPPSLLLAAPPFLSFLRVALFSPTCRAKQAAAPATAVRSFFFLQAMPATSYALSGQTLPAPALPAAEGHRGGKTLFTPAVAEGYTTRKKTQSSHLPTCSVPCLLPSLPLHTTRHRGRPLAREPPRLTRGGAALSTTAIPTQLGAVPLRKDFTERKQGPGHPAARTPGRVYLE